MAEKSEEKGKEKAMEDVKPAAQVKESKSRARNNPRKYYGRPRRDKETQRHGYQDRSPNYDYEWSGEDQREWVGHDSRDWAGHEPRKWASHDQRQWAGRPRNQRKEKKPLILTKARNETQSKEDTTTKDSQKPIPIVTNELTTPTQPQTTPTHQELTRRINKVIIVKQGNKKTSRNNRETSKQHKRKGDGEKTVTVSTAQTSELVQQLTAGVYECMVCCDRVRGRDEVWACPKCYNLFHLKCISRWAKSPAAAVNEGNHEEGWRCPGCQSSSTVIPSVYKCFCGRVVNPGDKRGRGDMTVPHSCGDPCHRRLASSDNDSCKHKCHQLCHPGPCPPCAVTVLKRCPCGKTSSMVRCSQRGALPSCGEDCGKKLNCARHFCRETCHEGVCGPCTLEIEVVCFCKRKRKVFQCGDVPVGVANTKQEVGGVTSEGFSCHRMCNRPLSCGNHTCEEACHLGACPPCVLDPSTVTHCPCGATPIGELLPVGTDRSSCLDDVPICDRQCSKPHPCGTEDGAHMCLAKCHIGDCPSCTLTSDAVCKCSRSTAKVPCNEMKERAGFDCNRVCRKPMSCGRHKCQTKCCVSEDHECRRVCGRKFSCGLHTCPDICHPRGCGQCWNISYEELACHCGGEVLLPPISCGTRPPTCSRPCARLHPCDHPVTHPCHDEETCPQCTFLTEKLCMGGHTVRRHIPCYLKDVSCGMPCGKPLPCGMHYCIKTCHKGECSKDNETCKQPCTLERKYCSHPCSAPCHPGNQCPDTACNAKVMLKCGCGYRTEKSLCLFSSAEVMSLAFQKLHQKGLGTLLRELQSGQSVQVNTVSLENLKERRLECNEECAQFERNKRLAEALELSDVEYSPAQDTPQYSAHLMEQTRENRAFVESLEVTFKQLVLNAHQAGGQSKTHTFKPMRKNQRHTIHELAQYYNCTSDSYDTEPIRNVVVTATNKSCIPSILLSQSCDAGNSRIKIMPPPVLLPVNRPESRSTIPEPRFHSTIPDYFNDKDV